MSIIDRIERYLDNYRFLNGEYPLSIQLTEAGKTELEMLFDEKVTITCSEKYKTEGTEFGRYRDIKVYVERPKELKIL